jgi:Flp pilus assembly protein TadG
MTFQRPRLAAKRPGRMFGERGASAVEAALVTPVVMAMLFGIIEMGFVFKDYLAVGAAVRSGVRIGAASPRNATFAQTVANRVASTGGAMNLNDVQELWVYKVDPLPAQGGTGTDKPVGFTTFSGCTTCVKFTWNAATKVFVQAGSPTWASNTQNACTLASGGPPDRIGVYMKLKHDPFTGFVFKTLFISEASVLTLEPLPVSTVCK